MDWNCDVTGGISAPAVFSLLTVFAAGYFLWPVDSGHPLGDLCADVESWLCSTVVSIKIQVLQEWLIQ